MKGFLLYVCHQTARVLPQQQKVCRGEVQSSPYAMPEITNQFLVNFGQVLVYLRKKMRMKVARYETKGFISCSYISPVRLFVTKRDKTLERCSDLRIGVAIGGCF